MKDSHLKIKCHSKYRVNNFTENSRYETFEDPQEHDYAIKFEEFEFHPNLNSAYSSKKSLIKV